MEILGLKAQNERKIRKEREDGRMIKTKNSIWNGIHTVC